MLLMTVPFDPPVDPNMEADLGYSHFESHVALAEISEEDKDTFTYFIQGKGDVDETKISKDALDLKPGDNLKDVVIDQVNIALDPDTESTPDIIGIADHQWTNGMLELLCIYDSMNQDWHSFDLVQSDDPTSLAKYVTCHNIGNSANAQLIKRWSRVFKKTLRRVFKHYIKSNCFKFYSNSYYPISISLLSRRITKARKAKFGDAHSPGALAFLPSCTSQKAVKYKYGIEVPRNWGDVICLDAENGDLGWQEAMKKKIGALLNTKYFNIQDDRYCKPPPAYQYACMHMVYAVKQDLCKKAQLVCDGSRVDPRTLNTQATVVRGISVRLLDVITHHWKKCVIAGDISNAFVQSPTEERVFTRLGDDFGEHAGKVELIVKTLYRLTTSAAVFWRAFANFLRSMGLTPVCYDRDVWMIEAPT